MPSALFTVFLVIADSPPQEHIEDFADARNLDALGVQLIEQHPFRRRHRVIVAIRGALKRPRFSCERTRNYAPHFVRSTQDFARDVAHLVELEQGNDVLVRGDLEHGISGSVDDPGDPVRMCSSPSSAIDSSTGSGFVAERAASHAAFEFVHDFRRKSMREEEEMA